MKNKEKNYIDFGEWLYIKRKENSLTEIDLVEKINLKNVNEKTIKKWERDLELPDMDEIYKLSEIFMIESVQILNIKQQTLQSGVNGIHKTFVRWLSYFLGISIYGAIWINRIIWTILLIVVTIWFYMIGKSLG